MAEKARKKVKSRKACERKRKQGLKKIGEGLQKELDAIVAPIGIEEKELPGERDWLAEETPQQALSGRVQGHQKRDEGKSGILKRDKARKKERSSWDIVIGETD
ncbi:MAG: hypothetical protein GTO12_22335 [Proteobacteria bacterium]|nr:hypothetical protein [Pseudomonadota bacterium]